MSWHSARKRFQKDLEHLPRVLIDNYLKESNRYTLPTFETNFKPIPAAQQKTKIEDVGLTSGDFVYITKGKNKGMISTLYNYSSELDTVLVSNVNSKKIIPKAFWVENQTSHLMDYPDPIARSDVKLAAKDKDEKGKVFYVVADEVIYKEKYYDDRYKRWLPKRFIKNHETIEVPWPNPPQESRDDYLSTRDDVAFEKTWELQSIAKPPFPAKVLSELRNPHSSYKKKVISSYEARKLNAPEMPLSDEQKIYLAKKAQQKPKELKRLSPEIQDFIGERIAAHVNKIENPNMLAHLEALSTATIPDFQKNLKQIEQNEKND